MTDKKRPQSQARREFLRRASVATGAVGAVAATMSAAPAQSATNTGSGRATGYRETDHVKQYYDLARF